MLSYRSRSCTEIKDDLCGKGFPAKTIDSIVSELAERGLIDDRLLARDLVASGQRARKSRSRIYADLRKRGFDREMTEEALATCFDPEMERRAAGETMRKLLHSGSSPPTEDDIERAARRLSSRGFTPSAVAQAIYDMRGGAGVSS
jgi:regulatory protein